MNDYVVFRMNDFLGNAGIVGLAKLLETLDSEKEYYRINDTCLEVQKSFLLEADLTQAYFDTLIEVYQAQCPYKRILEQITFLVEDPNKQEKEFSKKLKVLKKDLESNRYKTGYETIKDSVSNIDLYEELKRLVSLNNSEAITESLKQIRDLLNQNLTKETFFMKDIAYFIINNFWEAKSFLNRNNAKKNMKEVHKKEIEEVLKNYLKIEDKGKTICIECGAEVSGTNSISSSFINDFSEDFARKNSNYWNFKPNCYFCPKCLFLYTLIPLGFAKLGSNFLFINANNSLTTLIDINSQKYESEETIGNKNYYYLYNQVLQNLNEKNIGRLNNIQVITRQTVENGYHFNIISPQILDLLRECKKELQLLSEHGYIKDMEGYRNIYEEVLLHLLYNQELYRLLNELLRFGLNAKDEYVIHSCKLIYQIEGRRRKVMNPKYYSIVAKEGNEYRKSMERSGKADSTIGISYKMLNALKIQNCNQFLDIMIRLSNALNMTVPKPLIKAIGNIEEFKNIGYAFIIGFRGGYYEKEEKELLDLKEKMKQFLEEGGNE